jgi:hypothetical protein
MLCCAELMFDRVWSKQQPLVRAHMVTGVSESTIVQGAGVLRVESFKFRGVLLLVRQAGCSMVAGSAWCQGKSSGFCSYVCCVMLYVAAVCLFIC